MQSTRRNFLKGAAITAAGSAALAGMALNATGCASSTKSNANPIKLSDKPDDSYLIVSKDNGLRITGTFLDEISHDIPHQN